MTANIQNTAFKLIQVINNRLTLNSEGVSKLKQIKGYIFPICIVGPILTGKSSLLNRMIGKAVFKVGETTIPTSKGIWTYIRQIKLEGQRNSVWELIMDVQGFDNSFSECTEEVDLQLLLFVVYLCKIVMYNSFGALDSKIFERIANLSNYLPSSIKYQSQIVFVQRDFALQLTNFENERLKTDEYLQYFIKNYKDQITIKKLIRLFKSNYNVNSNQIINQLQTFSCVLISHPGQIDKYNKSIYKLNEHVLNKILRNLVKKQQPYRHNQIRSVVQFVYSMTKCVELLSSSRIQHLKQLQELSEKSREQQKKQWLSLYKLSISQKSKKQLKQNFPLPQQLLLFKYKKMSQQSIQKLSSHKQQSAFTTSVIGQDKLQQHNAKAVDKLKSQNNTKIAEFIQSKIIQIIASRPQQEFTKSQQQLIVNNLINYYPFINQSHCYLIKYHIYEQLYHANQRKYSSKAQQNISKMKQHQQIKLKALQLDSQLQQKNSTIARLQNQVKSLKQKIQKYHHYFHDYYKSKYKPYHLLQCQEQQLLHHQNMAKQIENQLQSASTKQNNYQQIQSDFRTQQKLQLIDSINQIKLLLADDRKNQQKNQLLKILFLQSANNKLREHIEQLLGSNTYSHVLQSQYQEVLAKLENREKQIKTITIQKNGVIQELTNEIKHQKQLNKWLQSDIEIFKQTSNDKSRSSEFLQKIVKSKQTQLEKMRAELFENTRKYTYEINAMKSTYSEKQIQMTKNISMLVIKTQQLSTKNSQLQKNIGVKEEKYKKDIEEKLQQKQKIINKQTQKIKQLQNTISANISEYMNMSKNIEQVIINKDQYLHSLSKQIQTLKLTNESISQQIQSSKQRCEEYKQKYNQSQTEKNQLQSKMKRDGVLTDNKIKHLQQHNQKLKVQIKQKENTFNMMLLQLRTNNILSSSINSSNFGDEKKYRKKIDYLQEIAKHQLDEISNRSKSKQQKWQSRDDKLQGRLSLTTVKPNGYFTRSECQDMIENGNGIRLKDKFRVKYETDQKPKKNLKLQGFAYVKNPTVSNIKACMSSSYGFRTARKKQ